MIATYIMVDLPNGIGLLNGEYLTSMVDLPNGIGLLNGEYLCNFIQYRKDQYINIIQI
jgi:hypothetical protein